MRHQPKSLRVCERIHNPNNIRLANVSRLTPGTAAAPDTEDDIACFEELVRWFSKVLPSMPNLVSLSRGLPRQRPRCDRTGRSSTLSPL
jgi:hypothetical protein